MKKFLLLAMAALLAFPLSAFAASSEEAMMAETGSEAVTAEAPQDDTLDLDEDSLEPVATGIEDIEAVEKIISQKGGG